MSVEASESCFLFAENKKYRWEQFSEWHKCIKISGNGYSKAETEPMSDRFNELKARKMDY
jgi:predicted NAD-dependent protein-ADP-ribosyltransferase YbiA (DUF1768 family)